MRLLKQSKFNIQNMDRNNHQFNPHRYEDYLSSFGRKVLNVLIKNLETERVRLNNTHQNRVPPSLGKRETITDKESNRQSPPHICQEINKDCDYDVDRIHHFNTIDQSPPPIPTASQLVISINTQNNKNNNSYALHHTLNIINKEENHASYVENRYKSKRFSKNDQEHNIVTSTSLLVGNEDYTCKKISNVYWNDMFDTELLSNSELILNQSNNCSPKNVINEEVRHETNNEDAKNLTSERKRASCKRKSKLITDVITKKVKKVLGVDQTKNNFRKQKYTKTVKNWLDDVVPNNLVEDDTLCDKSGEQKLSKTEIAVHATPTKPNKKVIQTQLANKDGIMKFDKPKSEQNKRLQIPEKCADSSKTEVQTNVKEKKTKPKFVAPIKSQIPVKDKQYTVITVDTEHLLKFSEIINASKGKISMILTYRNGFSQLNEQHTEDDCSPNGIFIGVTDAFYYLIGSNENYKYILETSIKNSKIICYEGKQLLIYLKSQYDININGIELIDAKVGGSLLEPDNPPENFSDLQNLLSFTPEFTIATECSLQKTAWYSTLLQDCEGKLVALLMEENLWNVFVEIEMKLLPIIAEMERRGVAVDLDKLKSMEDILVARMKAAEIECYKAAGKQFQINSAAQVRALIYDELQLDKKCNVKIRETITKGAKSTSEAMLRSLVSVHPLPRYILEYRHLHKAYATFVSGIAQHVVDGVVRPNWVQMAAVTGRIACKNPNLQAIPKAPFSLTLFPQNNEESETLCFREVYVSRAGHSLVGADFQHVECRVFAHAAADGQLQRALAAAPDLFRTLAAAWLRKEECAVRPEERDRTKRVVYASLYGGGCRALMDILQEPYERARAVLASFNRTFPSLKSFGTSVVSRCGADGGRLASLCGRVRRFPHIGSERPELRAQAERQAVNFVVQGSAADLCKKAMALAAGALAAGGARGGLLLQIHDELVWEVRDDQLHDAAVTIKRAMEGCGEHCGLGTRLPVVVTVGKCWGRMQPYPPPGLVAAGQLR